MPQPYVRADVRAFLDRMAASPRPAFTAEVLAQVRLAPPEAMGALDLPVGEMAVVRDLAMPGPGGPLRLRLYDPRPARAPGPVIVFCHGGGFILGSIDSHAGIAAEIAQRLDLPVFSVEYRLAPEHRWPAAPDDAEAAARWVAAEAASLDRAATSLILCGDSAGGNLSIVTALALRDRPAAVPVRLLFPLYPGTDHSRPYPSRTEYGDGYGLETVNMALYDKHYAGDPQHARMSPLLADLAGLPPTLLVTAALDPLRDEGRAFAAALVAAGVPTSYREITGTIHGFASYRRMIPSAQDDLVAVLAVARVMLDEPAG